MASGMVSGFSTKTLAKYSNLLAALLAAEDFFSVALRTLQVSSVKEVLIVEGFSCFFCAEVTGWVANVISSHFSSAIRFPL